MKRHTSIIALLGILMLLATGCTHNNGDIGPLFGQWKVTTMEGNGTQLPEYAGNMFWSFQSQTIEIKTVGDNHTTRSGFGNWSREGDELLLDFPDTDRQPPAESHLPPQCRLHIIMLDRGKAIIEYRLPEGGSITYTLKKW